MADHSVILFDGVCNFCNAGINWIIKRDKQDRYRFASLQSPFGQSVLKKLNLPQNDFNTFILLEDDHYYFRSTGALKVAKGLGGIWRLSYFLIFIPERLRDYLYNIVAKNRYMLFGKKEECMIPTMETKIKFLS